VSPQNPHKSPLYLIGASGHAKVVVDLIEKTGAWEIRGILDDNPELAGTDFLDYPVLGSREYLVQLDIDRDALFIAIGDNRIRRRIASEISAMGFHLPVLIHPSAVIGRNVAIGMGSVVMAGVVVNSAATISSYCILNTGCTVDHDGRLGEAVHVSPGAHLAGNVFVGEESWIGIGSSIIEGCRIGNRCIIAAGAVVVCDVSDDMRMAGVPARPMKGNANSD
jgi:sugar O-acyltransferase (sialic acid O-acetyltransferase NeuD family)